MILYSGRAESVMIEKSVIHESEPVDKSEDSPLMTRDEDSEDDDQRLSSTSKPKVPRVLPKVPYRLRFSRFKLFEKFCVEL